MKILLPLSFSILIFFLAINFSVIFASSHLDSTSVINPSKQNKLLVSFENNVSPSYDAILDPNERFILSQSHSWIRDESSRYNLVSYSIDGSDPIPISRLARGDFTLDVSTDSSHSVVFLAVPQFPIAVEGADVFFFTPESPTRDNWFDAGSSISVVVPKLIDIEQNKIRRIITDWSIDKAELKKVLNDDSEFLSVPAIEMSNLHIVDIIAKTQFKLDVLSEYGTTVGEGWHDAGSEVTIRMIPPDEGLIRRVVDGWEGPDVKADGNSAQLTIRGPTTLQVKWTTDNSPLVLAIVIPVAGGIALIFWRIKTVSASVKKPLTEKKPDDKLASMQYATEITDYVKQKTLENLGLMRESNLITESRYLQIKKKL